MHTARVILCALALHAAMCSPIISDNDDPESVLMGSVSTVSADVEMPAPQELVNGAEAMDDITVSGPGPKVNGAFAVNVLPTEAGRLSNADCAGHMVNGRCLKPFPRGSRSAAVADNMESPEQGHASGFEPDLHSFVRTHFHQDVMGETQMDTHNVGLPGIDISNREMNKNTNTHADAVSDGLFPVGHEMMIDGDAERFVDITHVMRSANVSSTMNSESELNSAVKVETGDAQKAITDASPVGEIPPEVEPVPTPTPTPTPDPEILRHQVLVQEEHAKQIAVCLDLLEKDGYSPDGLASMQGLGQLKAGALVEKKDDCQVAVQLKAETKKESIFNPANVKQNLQNLVIYCINKSTQDLATAVNGSTDDDTHLTVQRSTRYSQSLVKYASALTCADSEDFPGCMPSEAEKLLQQGPVNGVWSCF